MHLSTHRRIGLWLYRQLTEEESRNLSRTAFLLGNLRPDFQKKGPGHRHVFDDSQHCLEEKLACLLDGGDGRHASSLALGEICHHIADTFCLYHHEMDKFEDRRSHFAYEVRLHQWFLKTLRTTPQSFFPAGQTDAACGVLPDVAALMRHLKRQRAVYASSPSSFETDMRFTLYNTMAVLRPLLPCLVQPHSLRSSLALH